MRFTLDITSDNDYHDIAALAAMLVKVADRVANMADNGNDLDGDEYNIRDLNGNKVGTWTGYAAAAGEVRDEDFMDDHDHFRDDVEADADVLAMAGFGTDEDYGYYGSDDDY